MRFWTLFRTQHPSGFGHRPTAPISRERFTAYHHAAALAQGPGVDAAFEDGDLVARALQRDRGGQAADARAYHDGAHGFRTV